MKYVNQFFAPTLAHTGQPVRGRWSGFAGAIKWLVLVACCLCGIGRNELSAATVLPGFAETVIPGHSAGSWSSAVGVTFDSTGRMFVWERDGRVWFKDPTDASFTLLIDISEEVGAWLDHGFLGFALDPNFRVNGHIYLLYAVDRHHLLNFGTPSYNPNTNQYNAATMGRLTRYTCRASDDFRSVDLASRFTLIGETIQTGIPVCSPTHGVGSLVFGQDGTLLVSCGDGAGANNADTGGPQFGSYSPQALADGILRPKEDVGAFRSQLIDSLSGKILRIDPATGNGVPSNPFYDAANPRAAKSRVWALGLRNPFRMTLRPESGSHSPEDGQPGVIYLGDVGWNTWESMKVVTGPGQNFGWPVYEGLVLTPGYSIAVANQDAPNPLYPASGCNEFFSFIDLLKEDTLNPAGQPPFPNPCDSSQRIPASIPQFLRTRPVLDWHHFTATTRFPTYTPSGEAATGFVGRAGSAVSGTPFQGNCSVGGAWYTGTNFPAQYRNLYYFADWGQGVIKTLALDQNNKPSALGSFVSNAGFIVCIVQHPTDGSLYYVTYDPDSDSTSVVQLSYAGNRTPVASASANVLYGPSPLNVQFSGSGSSDPDGQAITYSWNFGDGSPVSTEANPAHTFSAPAGVPTQFVVTLTVTDSGGLSAQSTLNISVNNTPPNVTIVSPADGTSFPPDSGTTVDLVATVSDAQSSDAQLQYKWVTVLHHNDHDHASPPDTNHVTTSVISPTGCDGINIYYYRIVLTVTDPAGLSTTREVRLFPDCGPNTPPTISNIPDQLGVPGEELGPINFTIADAETPAVNLQLSASSSNPALVPVSSIVFGGSGTDRTITLTPTAGQNGTATITVTVTDGPTSASDTFLVTVGAPPPPNQITALSFNEGTGTTAADSSASGHDGTLVNGPTWTAGKFGNGLSLDGTNDYVSVANPSTLNFGTSNFTVSLYVKRQANGVEHTIFSKTANTNWVSGGKELFIGTNNRLTFGGWGRGEVSSTGTITNDGLWHHVTVTFVDSSNTLTFYIDGVASGGGTLNLAADGASHVVKIGGFGSFRGLVDEFRIFNRVLSTGEVQSVMNNPILSATDTTPPVRSNGQPSGTLPAGTTQATLSLTTNESATSRYSTVPGTAYANMAGTFSTTGGTNHSTTVSGLTDGTSYNFYVRSIDGSGNANTNDFTISFSIASPPPQTVQLTVINGTGSGFYPPNTPDVPVSANPPPPGQQFDLWTGDIEVVDNIMSPNTTVTIPSMPVTIEATYKALPTYPLTVNSGTGSGPYTAGTLVTVTANAAPAGQQFAAWTGNVSFLANSSSPTTTLTMPSQPVTITATYTASQTPPNQVTALSFSEGSGTAAADSSGSGHNGTLVNGPGWTAGKFGNGLSFDGSNDYVSVANPSTLNFGTSNFTIALWIKRQATGAEHTIFTKTADASWVSGGKELFISASNNKLGFGSWGKGELFSTGTITNDGLWHHVAMTFVDSSNTVTFYIDGVASGGGTLNLAADGASHVVKIGGFGSFRGLVDELRIFSRALSPSEVQTIMNNAIQ